MLNTNYYVLSSLMLGLYEEAEILCNCLKFDNENIFAFLYGFAAIGLKKDTLAMRVLSSPEFLNGFRFLSGKSSDFYFENWKKSIGINFFENETLALNQLSAKIFNNDFLAMCSSSKTTQKESFIFVLF